MKKMAWLGCLFAALFLVAGGRVALADNVSMHFDGVGGGSLGGEYVYPYNFTITTSHGTFQTALMCIDFHDNASIGGTWTADAELASSFTGDLGKNLLKAAAIIDHFGSTNAADANWAVWTLFGPPPVPTLDNPDGANILSILAFANGETDAQLAAYGNWLVFIPNGSGGIGNSPTQWFMGGPTSLTPEPGALLLLGSGILGLAMIIHFRKRTSRVPQLTL